MARPKDADFNLGVWTRKSHREWAGVVDRCQTIATLVLKDIEKRVGEGELSTEGLAEAIESVSNILAGATKTMEVTRKLGVAPADAVGDGAVTEQDLVEELKGNV